VERAKVSLAGRESSFPLQLSLIIIKIYLYYFSYYYLRTTFINPFKRDFAKTISPGSSYEIEGRK